MGTAVRRETVTAEDLVGGERREVDKEWLLDRLRERGLSMRALARALGYDIAVVSRVVNGRRRLRLSEVEPIAQALGTSLQETSARLGLGSAAAGVPVTMTLLGTGEVVDEDWGERIDGAPYSAGAEGVRALTGGSAHQMMDGWTFIVGEERPAGEALGRVALLTFDDGSRTVGKPARAFGSRRWSCLVPTNRGLLQRAGQLVAVRAVTGIVP